ncbi:SICA antigen [Plasmodium coatneyi]|uniref:SICA antigen n=1 Tax=Plasmodium coatneyi TaxID=208452 RepID=A0A1B1DSX1_9APIC|nr:SICA antigen [Plasmodium coatneyi]ANQ05873.1 SICA antigen [Plasmodium coatneyi]
MAPRKSKLQQDHTKVEEEVEHDAGKVKMEYFWYSLELGLPLPPNNPPTTITTNTIKGDVTCTDGKLQESLKDVIDKWHNDKGRAEKDWKKVWEEIENRINPLSKDISTYKSNMGTYCSAPKGKDSTWTEADSNACMIITAGLKHIYQIKEDENHDKGGKDGKKNNRTFKQTAACLILNELIRKMKDKTNSCTQKISIQAGINHAFSKSAEIKKETPCNGDSDCFECTQQDYSSCKMGNEQVREKLKEKFDKDKQIQKALGDIYPPSIPSSSKTGNTKTKTTKKKQKKKKKKKDPEREGEGKVKEQPSFHQPPPN